MRLAAALIVLAPPALADPVLVPAMPAPAVLAAEPVSVPSGQKVTFLDAILNEAGPDGQTARFRFVAPQIVPGGVDFETAVADMQHLCDAYALPRVTGTQPLPQQVVISLSSEAVPFGDPSPEVTQFFEAYRLENGACIWEVF